ncbi:MAG TPA: HNH endonuclease [Sphingobacterium sp.]|nr:HNH endonuclease [Sphingobacterium sp.]HCX55427.1 HNH endonuclease [Sphingobacterium sp.]
MKIELKEIKVRDLTNGYEDNQEDGVVGYGGKLDIRPPYQREFIYKDKQRDAVIDTITKKFPLNVMYWAVREDDGFEIIDGQQRTISICQYVNNDFSLNGLAFHNLPKDKQEQILDYELMVYFCEGTESEKLEWFKTINIAGEKLTDQELRNAVYSGSWVTDAKRYFSKNSRPKIGDEYLGGSANRQEYLETAIEWISEGNIESYMSKNQHEPNANELWLYFQAVISWVKATFPKYRKEMKGLSWGLFYNEFKNNKFDSKKLEEQITELMIDEDVENKKGIYAYVLTGKEKYLNIRAFSDKQKREAYERQEGICVVCKNHFEINEMEADHIDPWHSGGKTISENCQMLCKEDNRRKSGK